MAALRDVDPRDVAVVSKISWRGRYPRVLRLLRMMKYIPFLPPIVGTFMRMLPPAGTLLLVMLTTMYFFAVLGVQCFGGLINKNPSLAQFAVLRDSDFGESDYWANNFNDILSGMVRAAAPPRRRPRIRLAPPPPPTRAPSPRRWCASS